MQRDGIPPELAQLIAVFIQSIFYGLYLVTSAYCLLCLLQTPSSSTRRPCCLINWRILTVVTSLWVIATLSLALGIVRLVQAFVYKQQSNSPMGALGDDWVNIAKSSLTCLQILVADSFMVWRFWVVYQKSKIAFIVPALLWLGGLAIAVWAIYLQVMWSTQTEIRTATGIPVRTVFWIFTIALNVYTTSAIVWRIWKFDRETKACLQDSEYNQDILDSLPSSRLSKTIKLVVESGLIYSLMSITVFVSQVLESNSVYITTAINNVVIGIAFNLIILRVSSSQRGDVAREVGKGSVVHFATRSTLNVDSSSGTNSVTGDDHLIHNSDLHRISEESGPEDIIRIGRC